MTTALKLDATPRLVWLQFRRKTKGQPAIAVTGDVMHGLADGTERTEVVKRLHQLAEARLVRDDVDRYLRKIRVRAPATDSLEPYRRLLGLFGFKVNFMSSLGNVTWTN